jgi:hypothetical protein
VARRRSAANRVSARRSNDLAGHSGRARDRRRRGGCPARADGHLAGRQIDRIGPLCLDELDARIEELAQRTSDVGRTRDHFAAQIAGEVRAIERS